jgi:hypothetical protein
VRGGREGNNANTPFMVMPAPARLESHGVRHAAAAALDERSDR